jgi:endonuclease/exonuclease/phosphatase family metal-dependent hydrolase
MFQNRPVTTGLLLALTLGLIVWAVARGEETAGPRPLRIATWNLQWLVDQQTARMARIACRDDADSPLPCDVARALARDSADLARLAALVRRLDADVIAFQEVQNAAIARRVFRDHTICITSGTGVQQVGFAIRAGLSARCEAPVTSVTANGRGRAAQALTLFPAGAPPVELLAVHLKSGCARDPLDSPTAACQLLARQAEALGAWIAGRQSAGADFIVLGDFNRGGLPAAEDAFWSMLLPHHFEAAAVRLPFRNCVFGAPYTEFIDHILVSRTLLSRLHSPAFEQMRFRAAESTQFRLSDHCPVSVLLSPTHTL